MNEKHTPGPMEVFCEFPAHVYVKADSRAVTVADFGVSAVLSQTEKEANAALMAAAPDLLQACRDAERALRDGGTFPIKGITWETLTAAISRATSA